MTSKEKALEVYEKMDLFTNGYVGSSVLINMEYDDVKIKRTKKLAMVLINEIIDLDNFSIEGREYWSEVSIELNVI